MLSLKCYGTTVVTNHIKWIANFPFVNYDLFLPLIFFMYYIPLYIPFLLISCFIFAHFLFHFCSFPALNCTDKVSSASGRFNNLLLLFWFFSKILRNYPNIFLCFPINFILPLVYVSLSNASTLSHSQILIVSLPTHLF